MTLIKAVLAVVVVGLSFACAPVAQAPLVPESAAPVTQAPPVPESAAPVTQAPPVPQSSASVPASPDYDGDGKADLAVTVDSEDSWGSVTVFYGSGSTATALGEAAALLGRDLNGDGYTDLVRAHSDGSVDVLFGAATGLDATQARGFGASVIGSDFRPAHIALVESPTPRLVIAANRWGEPAMLVVYPLGADGLASAAPSILQPGSGEIPTLGGKRAYIQSMASSGSQLFLGAPYVAVSGRSSAGVVAVLTFGDSGVSASRVITQNTAGVGGSPEKNDYFGYSVATGDDYLAVGARGDRVDGRKASGAVQLFRLSGTEVTAAQRLTQGSADVPGKVERSDSFGMSVAVGRVCDGRPAIIVGGTGEVITKGHEGDGSAWVIPLSRDASCTARQLYEGHGLSGTPTYFRFLGSDVAALRDADATADQVVINGGGYYSDGPVGRLIIWDSQTQTSRLSVEGFYDHPAGR